MNPKTFSESTEHSQLTVALAGNPNSGKTTIFNELTGARQHVGNYPGVTVEKKEGVCRRGATALKIVDLPGTYSLTAYSPEELVARNVLVHEKPDAVVDIVDASNLERNLYLAVQIMELGCPTVLALNMADMAEQRGITFDLGLLQELLGVRIVPTVGHKGRGLDELTAAAVATARGGDARPLRINYGAEIEAEITRLSGLVEQAAAGYADVPPRWLAVKLLEGDKDVSDRIGDAALLAAVGLAVSRLEKLLGDSPEALIADRRYGFISGACQEAVRGTAEARRTASDRIDSVVTNRVLGLPIFLALMYLVFQLTFTLGTPPMDWIESGFGWLGGKVAALWPDGSGGMLQSLLVDGIIGGVGGVVVFLPNILLLFLAIAILEDSGYMARAAFIMDRLMHKIGLHGKSFVPMLIGFGCTVPAIMATRTLENQRDRLTTMLVLPLISCGARLPIYALIIPAFFPDKLHAPMLWLMYLIGIALAIICAKLLKSTLLRGEAPPFVMELPPYRMPTLKSVTLHMWDRGGAYLKKAGTVILGVSIIMWAMAQWPKTTEAQSRTFEDRRAALESRQVTDAEIEAAKDAIAGDEEAGAELSAAEDADAFLAGRVRSEWQGEIAAEEAEASLEASLMGRVGRGIEPVLRPCGFDWKIATAMIGAFAAKEVFVAQMGIVYSLGEQDEESVPLRERLQASYTPLVGFCIMLFCLVSAPCMATIAVTRRESNSWKWALFQLGGLTVLAWVVTTIIFQAGTLLGIGV